MYLLICLLIYLVITLSPLALPAAIILMGMLFWTVIKR
jgi:hypothetical protein